MYYLMDDNGTVYYIDFSRFPILQKEKQGYERREDAEYALREMATILAKDSLQFEDIDYKRKIVDSLHVGTGLTRVRHH